MQGSRKSVAVSLKQRERMLRTTFDAPRPGSSHKGQILQVSCRSIRTICQFLSENSTPITGMVDQFLKQMNYNILFYMTIV